MCERRYVQARNYSSLYSVGHDSEIGWLLPQVMAELEAKLAAKLMKDKAKDTCALRACSDASEPSPHTSTRSLQSNNPLPPSNMTLSLAHENLRRLFDEIDVDQSGSLDELEVKQLIQRYFSAIMFLLRESRPGLFEKAGLASCCEEDLVPETVIISFIQAFSGEQVKSQGREYINRRIQETMSHVFDSIDVNHVRLRFDPQ
jgi:hypothetical protein